jgi:acyl-homoserine-lactone acylase
MEDPMLSRACALSCAAAVLVLVWMPATPFAARVPWQGVDIQRDRFGVPHILAQDWESAGYGFGWAQAEDHAAEMGRRYLAARGEAARVLGPSFADGDFAMRRLDNRNVARRAVAQQGQAFREWLRGFVAGLNAYVAARRATLPAWMPVIDEADVLANGRAGAVVEALRAPSWLTGATRPAPGAASHAYGGGRLADADDIGSNALALAGSRTTTGQPMLLGNPHLRWSQLYWEAHVRVRGRMDFYGSTLVGIPVLRAGFNDRLGYVQTNNAPDLEDIYALPLELQAATSGAPPPPARYRLDGTLHDIVTVPISIDVVQPDGRVETVTREFRRTALGPVIHETAEHAYVVRSMALDSWRYYEGFLDLAQSRSRREFMRSLGRGLVYQSNYTYADADGNVQYVWNARLPRRRDASIDYAGAVEPGVGTAWIGVHRLQDLPQSQNPPGGYVQNANNPPEFVSLRDRLGMARFPSYVERGPLGPRPQVALAALESRDRWSADDLLAMKFAPRMLVAERVVPDLLHAASALAERSADLDEALTVLGRWDLQVSASSRGAVLFQRAWDDYVKAVSVPWAQPFDPGRPLDTPAGLGDPATLLRTLEAAAGSVRSTFGSTDVAWGEANRFRANVLDLPGEGASGAYGVYRVMGFDTVPGGAGGTRIAGFTGDGRPLAGTGDAWILLVSFTRPVQAFSVLAYGQTTDPTSPHSRDQLALFASRRLRPVVFTEAHLAAQGTPRYRPGAPGAPPPRQ